MGTAKKKVVATTAEEVVSVEAMAENTVAEEKTEEQAPSEVVKETADAKPSAVDRLREKLLAERAAKKQDQAERKAVAEKGKPEALVVKRMKG